MLYSAAIKRFKILLHFVNSLYYRDTENVSEGLGMASKMVVVMMYIIDIQCYITIVMIGDLGS